MNLIGKILTVLVLVMSVCFGTAAIFVYATHTNWRKVVDNATPAAGEQLGLKQQLEQEQQKNADLETEKQELETRLTVALDAKTQAHAKLSTEYSTLEASYKQLSQDYNQVNEEIAKLVASMKTTHDMLASLRREVEGDEDQGGSNPGLRKEIRLAQKEREDYFNRSVELKNSLNQAVQLVAQLRDRQLDLTEALADAKEVLTKHGLKPDPRWYASTPTPVEGQVRTVTADGTIVISIGEDDGLRKGHQLEVTRGRGAAATYVARIEVVQTDVDRSVCKVVPGREFASIAESDRVVSKITF